MLWDEDVSGIEFEDHQEEELMQLKQQMPELDSKTEMKISLNALQGKNKNETLQIQATINNNKIVILIVS